MNSQTDPFLTQLDLTGEKPDSWLHNFRQKSRDAYKYAGIPTARVESWKYTKLNRLSALSFSEGKDQAANDHLLPDALFDALACHRIVFLNGRFNARLSALDHLPEAVLLTSLANMLANDPERLRNRLGNLMQTAKHPFAALNGACTLDGLYLEIPDGFKLDKPILLISYAQGKTASRAFHPRHLVVMGNGSKADLVEWHCGDGLTFGNNISEIWVGAGAQFGHFKLQDEDCQAYHLANSQVAIQEDGLYNNFTLQLGARLARNEVNCQIAGSGVETHVNGAYFACGNQHHDSTGFIDHQIAKSNSNTYFKGVLDNQATAVFQGKIRVCKDAQKTDARQMNRALLLSRQAEMNAKPELEIYADDVKCSHGATVGELDMAQMFYLMTRGIPEQEARSLLIQAFLIDVLERIPDARIRDLFQQRLVKKMEKEE